MAGTKEIKRRIKSVKNTKKITKAMELVAASKMKRAVSATFNSRPYSEYSLDILDSLSNMGTESKYPLFETRTVNRILILLITSNRGLCGGYNSQVIKNVLNFIKNNRDKKIDFVTIGRKGESALRRLGQNVIASFSDFSDEITFRDVQSIADLFINMYKKNEVDLILIAYTHFLSGMLQTPIMNQILPIDVNRILRKSPPKQKIKIEFIIEPNYEAVIPTMTEKLTHMQVYQMILESNASEQSSRMVAMKNASEASDEMIDDLTLVFNKARQANITKEISEISAGMVSVG
jgi:F-type H+-transporting ATPase subunit gamma